MFLIESMTEYHTVGAVVRTAVVHGVVKLRKCYSSALFLFLCLRQALPVPNFDASSVTLQCILGITGLNICLCCAAVLDHVTGLKRKSCYFFIF